ncbi:MAG: FHA domain-containing protein, partial [Halobacteriovoraceae bacterium]|nr:FHA domain-containing protein [Halobacteriovoraceae bacterium]
NDRIEIENYEIQLKELPVASKEIEEVGEFDSSLFDDPSSEEADPVDDVKIEDFDQGLETESNNIDDQIEVDEEVDFEDESGFEVEVDSDVEKADDQFVETEDPIIDNDDDFEIDSPTDQAQEEYVENEIDDNEFEVADEELNTNGLELDSNSESEGDFSNNDNFEEGSHVEDPDAFGDNDSFGEGFENDVGETTKVYQTFAKFSLKLFGEFAPFDKYLLSDDETFVGRDADKCSIVLDDPEVSKVHAVIKRSSAKCEVVDLDSANGILFNGERVNRSALTNGDEFLIGDTTFTVEVTSDLLEAEQDMLMPVEDNQEVEIEEVIEEEVGYEDFDGEGGAADDGNTDEKSIVKKILKDPKKRMIAIFVLLGVLFLWLETEEDTPDVGPESSIAKKNKTSNENKNVKKKKHSAETLGKLEQNYALAMAKSTDEEFYEAKEYIDIVANIDPNYKFTQSLLKSIQESLEAIEKLKDDERIEKDRRVRQLKVNALLEKAKDAVKKREVKSAKNYFNLIYEMDPENIDVPPLKLEIEAYVENKLKKEQELAIKKAARQAKVDKLIPGRNLFNKGLWYQAINKLELFLGEKDMDEDLIKDAAKMLSEAKTKLAAMVSPLLSKARSFKEGEDLKQAYETYGELLKFDSLNVEALNERDSIFQALKHRSRKIYRDALVAESLSLYPKAKEKFQEVQQISPENSEYYIKATKKLENY